MEMKLNKEPFEKIKSGSKTIEMRLYDEKRKTLKVGDEIVFSNRENESDKIFTKVVALHIYPNFEELYKNFDKIELGYAKDEECLPSDMEKYYTKSEQEKYGVVGIEIMLKEMK